MTNELILRLIQFFLVFLIVWIFVSILYQAKKNRVNSLDRLRDRFA